MDPTAFPPQAAPGVPGQVARPPMAQGDGPQPQSAPAVPQLQTQSPLGAQLRQQAQTLIANKRYSEAEPLLQQAMMADGKFQETLAQKQNENVLAQPGEDAKNAHNQALSEHNFRQEFDSLSPVKNFRTVQPIFKAAIEASKGNNKAADLNMVYAFATMMDPGSVVREGESGMVRATQSASDYVKGLVNSVSGSATLSPQARANLLEQMNARYQPMKQAHDELANSYERIAGNSGIVRLREHRRAPS